MTIHPIDPVFDQHSRILILGSFPSIKSREVQFFYGHPQNRFWKVLAAVLQAPVPETAAQKQELLLKNGIALWDVIASCEIDGSADSSIRNVQPADLSRILNTAPIEQIFLNGRTAETYYNRYFRAAVPLKARCLPSTSPANAAWTLPKLIDAWHIITQ